MVTSIASPSTLLPPAGFHQLLPAYEAPVPILVDSEKLKGALFPG
jgi:hypothetical protein